MIESTITSEVELRPEWKSGQSASEQLVSE